MSTSPRRRRGITVLEVLIAIGILAIGLSSVVALIPAARSQASRAVILDRAAVMAANALADAATCGLLLEGGLTVSPVGGAPIVIDPAAVTAYQLAATSTAALRTTGIYSGLVAGGTAPAASQRLFTEGRDDVIVTTSTAAGATSDDLPVNAFDNDSAGSPVARSYEGRMSSLVCLVPPAVGGDMGRLSVVVFHARDPTLPVVTGTITNFQAVVNASGIARLARDVLKPGVVFWDSTNRRFHQAMSASWIETTGTLSFTGTASLTVSSGTLLSGTLPIAVQFLPDSVGLAERPYLPELPGPYVR